jgi:hypothetical protein
MVRAIDSPMPMPSALLVKNGSKISFNLSSGRNTPAVHGHQAKHVLRLGKSLHGCPGEPSRGLRIIGPHAFTVHIGDAEKMLCDLQSLVCGLVIPSDRLGRILRHTPSAGVHESDVELGARITLLGKGRQASKRGRVLAPVGRGDPELRRAAFFLPCAPRPI